MNPITLRVKKANSYQLHCATIGAAISSYRGFIETFRTGLLFVPEADCGQLVYAMPSNRTLSGPADFGLTEKRRRK